MRPYIHILVCTTFLLSASILKGQNLPQVIPPSPITREFNKYITYNVSMYNGLPDISIPLYNIQIKGVSIPISLSYHASGIKFRQDNGDVGVGWTLNPGFRVSRTIYGFADELFPMPSNSADSLAYYDGDNKKKDKYLSHFVTNSEAGSRPTSFNNELLDGEYDQFNYDLPSDGGTFIINDRVNKKASTLERSHIKIDYNVGFNSATQTTGILGLGITDESGVKYYTGNQLSTANNWVYETTASSGGSVATAWALTDIVNPEGEKVHFKYNQASNGGWIADKLNLSVSEAVTVDAGNQIMSNISTPEGYDGTYTTFLLSEITGENEKVSITRQAISNQVTSLDIKDISGNQIKRVVFYYSTSGSHNFLDSLKIQDQVSNNIESYKFEYAQRGVDANALDKDQWGYYKLDLPNPFVHMFHQEFADDMIYFSDGNSYNRETLNTYFSQYSDRSNVTATPDFYSLKKITYPTGGSTTYEYESNKFLEAFGQIKMGGGLRIYQISSTTANGQNPSLIRTYVYGNGENGYGSAPVYFDANYFASESVTLRYNPLTPSDSHFYPQRVINYSTEFQGDVDPGGFLSSYVVYPFVTEYQSFADATISNGKTTFKYDLQWKYLANRLTSFSPTQIPNTQYSPYSPLYVSRYEAWRNPLLIEQQTYKYQDGQYQPLKKDTYNYQGGFSEIFGLKVKPVASADGYNSVVLAYYNYITSFFNYGSYAIEIGKNLLVEKKEELYSPAGSTISRTTYQYNALDQVATETLYTSKSDSLKTVNHHPSEMIATGHDPANIYQEMINANIINPVIEKQELRNTQQISFFRTNYYQPFTSLFKPQSIESQTTVSAPVESRVRFQKYDDRGNVLSVSKEYGPAIIYVWSYNGQYPVAQITNASYSVVEAVLGGAAAVKTFRDNPAPSDVTVNNFLSSLRTALSLKDAQVMTYTYRPLVGMTSSTDAKRQTTYFEYDAFQRLINIKDHAGNIIKHMDYHYQGQ